MRSILPVILLLFFLPIGLNAADTTEYKVKTLKIYEHPIPDEIILHQDPEPVTLFSEFGLLFLRIQINEQGPFTFWLDTGSDISLISKEVVDKLELPILGKVKTRIQASHSRQILTSELTSANLMLGNTEFKNMPFLSVDTAHQAHELFTNLEVAGMLGVNLFYGIIMQLDFKDLTLNFKKSFEENENTLPLQKKYFFPVILATVYRDGKPQEYPFLIDTGFNGNIEMPECNKNQKPHEKSKHSLDFFNNVNSGFASTINGHIQVGSIRIENPAVRFMDKHCKKKSTFGLIGTRFLDGRTLILNLEKRNLTLY